MDVYLSVYYLCLLTARRWSIFKTQRYGSQTTNSSSNLCRHWAYSSWFTFQSVSSYLISFWSHLSPSSFSIFPGSKRWCDEKTTSKQWNCVVCKIVGMMIEAHSPHCSILYPLLSFLQFNSIRIRFLSHVVWMIIIIFPRISQPSPSHGLKCCQDHQLVWNRTYHRLPRHFESIYVSLQMFPCYVSRFGS